MAAEKKLLTEAEVAELLRVSRDAILKFKHDPVDPIPYRKAGRRYLYDENAVLRWAERAAKREIAARRRQRGVVG